MRARSATSRPVASRLGDLLRLAAIPLLLGALLAPASEAQIVPGGPGGATPPDKPPPAGGFPIGAPPTTPQDGGGGSGGEPEEPVPGAGATGGAAGGAVPGDAGGARGLGGKPEPLPGEPRCGWCGTTGRVPFDKGKGPDLEDESEDSWKVEYCSEAIDSPNQGLSWMPCPNCKTPSLKARAEKEYAEITARNKAWLDEHRRTDRLAKVEKPLVHVQTTHFCIVTDYPRITASDKKSYRTHEFAHLYARRLEQLHARFQKMFGVHDSNNLRNLHFVYIFEKEQQQFLAAPVYTALSGLPTVRRAGGSKDLSAVVTFWDKAEFPKDGDMVRHQIHEAVHQFTAVYYDLSWFKPGELGLSPPWLNDKYGWLDEGLSHWFEIDYDGIANTYCFREQDAHSRWGGSDWRKNIFKAVAAGDVPSFAEVITKSSQALSAKEHQFAWSWVDFLMQQDRLLMGKAMKLCKQKFETRDILKQAWGFTMIDFESRWSAYVKEAYAPSNKFR